MVRITPQLKRLIIWQTLLLLASRGCVAWSAWILASTINQSEQTISIFGLIVLGSSTLYAISKLSDWLFSTLHSRIHTLYVLPTAFAFCDKTIEAMLRLGQFQDFTDPAELASRLNKKADARGALGFLLHHILPPLFELALCAAALSWMGMGLLGWALVPVSALHIWISLKAAPSIRGLILKNLGSSGKAGSRMSQALEKCALARAYGTQQTLIKIMRDASQDETKAFIAQAKASDVALVLQAFPLALSAIFFFWAGERMVSEGLTTPGALAALMGIVVSSFSQLRNLAFAFDGLLVSTEALSLHVDILRAARQIPPPCESFKLHESGTLYLTDWRVERGNKIAFAAKNLTLKKGEKIFIVGKSGAGKSSFILSLLGFAQSSGEMFWDGKPWPISQSGLFAWMPQDHSAMSGTVRENLQLGLSTACDQQILDALQQAQLKDKIQSIGGLDADLTWRGNNLSGGESQRLALARALLSNRPVLLLDEPTSGLDALAEAKIINQIMALEDRSAFICVHRLHAIPSQSRVIVLDQGQIVEDDTLETLKNNDSLFASLWKASNQITT